MWDPFKDVEQVMKQMGAGGRYFASTASGWMPSTDVVESETGYRVVSDLGGVRKDDIDVVMDNNRLCISGTRPIPEWYQKDQSVLMSERGYGRFERCLQLPTAVVDTSLHAALSDGVLEVTMDKVPTKASTTARGGNRVKIE
jgi:HSP20 family protein